MVWTMIDHRAKIILFWSAKTACTTLKNMMFYYETGKIPVDPLYIHSVRGGYNETDEIDHLGRKNNEICFDDIRTKYKDYKSVIVYRDPYDRFCSSNIYNSGLENVDVALYITRMYPYKYKLTHHLELQTRNTKSMGDYKFDYAFDISQLEEVNKLFSSKYPEMIPYKLKQHNKGEKSDLYENMKKHYKSVIEEYYTEDIIFVSKLKKNLS